MSSRCALVPTDCKQAGPNIRIAIDKTKEIRTKGCLEIVISKKSENMGKSEPFIDYTLNIIFNKNQTAINCFS